MSDEIMREKFEANLTMAGRAKTSKGTYANNLIENQWKGFKWGYSASDNLLIEALEWVEHVGLLSNPFSRICSEFETCTKCKIYKRLQLNRSKK